MTEQQCLKREGWAWAALIMICIALILAGCGGTVPVVPARTAIPVECREPEPQRPAMPTELLAAGSSLDSSVQAMQAEIELREGYEVQLRTALQACVKPLR